MTGFGAAEAVDTLTSAMPRIVVTNEETLLSVFGSSVGVSIELTVAVLVMKPGDTVPITMVSVTLALLVMLPMLRITNPGVLVLMLPVLAEAEIMGALVGIWKVLVTPVKVVRPLLL